MSLLTLSLSTDQSHPSYHVFCVSSSNSSRAHVVTKSSGLCSRALGKSDVTKVCERLKRPAMAVAVMAAHCLISSHRFCNYSF